MTKKVKFIAASIVICLAALGLWRFIGIVLAIFPLIIAIAVMYVALKYGFNTSCKCPEDKTKNDEVNEHIADTTETKKEKMDIVITDEDVAKL